MQKRAFIIHGYHGYPEEAWMPWLKTELEKNGYVVALPAMPHPTAPTIPEWMAFITNLVGEPDAETVMVGHSLGVQAVIRYLEIIGKKGQFIKQTVLIAGAFPEGETEEEAEEEIKGKRSEADMHMLPWFTIPVDGEIAKKAAGKCTVILSDDDPYIPLEKAKVGFQAHMDAKILIQHGGGHFNEDDHITELLVALETILAN